MVSSNGPDEQTTEGVDGSHLGRLLASGLPLYGDHLRLMLLDLHVFHLSFFEVVIEYVSFLGSANNILTVGRDAELDVVRGDLELRALELVHHFSLTNVPYL